MDEPTSIFGIDAETLRESKEIKLRLPVAHLIKLHGLKLVKGKNISASVAEALALYFADLEHDREAR